MRHYILCALFLFGLIAEIIDRVKFERKTKHTKDEDYRALFRRQNNLTILLFAYLVYLNGAECV